MWMTSVRFCPLQAPYCRAYCIQESPSLLARIARGGLVLLVAGSLLLVAGSSLLVADSVLVPEACYTRRSCPRCSLQRILPLGCGRSLRQVVSTMLLVLPTPADHVTVLLGGLLFLLRCSHHSSFVMPPAQTTIPTRSSGSRIGASLFVDGFAGAATEGPEVAEVDELSAFVSNCLARCGPGRKLFDICGFSRISKAIDPVMKVLALDWDCGMHKTAMKQSLKLH